MEYFDKKVKDIFESAETAVPDGYSWEEMEAGIRRKMHPKRKDKRRLFWFVYGAVAIFVVLIYSISVLSTRTSDDNSLAGKTNIHSGSRNINTKELEELNNNRNSIIDIQGAENTKISKIAEVTKSNSSIAKFTKKETVLTGNTRDLNKVANGLENKNIPILEPVIRKQTIKYSHLHTIKKPVAYRQNERVVDVDINRYISFSSGLNTLFGKHENNQFADDYTTNLPGYYLDISLNQVDRKNWIKTIGYTYNNYISLFQFEKTDQVEKTFKNIIVIKNTNSLNGRSTEVFGDTTVLRSRYRNITYYNLLKTHSFYIGFGKEISLSNKLTVGIGSRLLYSFVLKAKGVSIDKNEELVYFNDKSNRFSAYNRFAFGINFIMKYRLSRRWQIGTSLKLDKSLNSISIPQVGRYYPAMGSVGVNINYTL